MKKQFLTFKPIITLAVFAIYFLISIASQTEDPVEEVIPTNSNQVGISIQQPDMWLYYFYECGSVSGLRVISSVFTTQVKVLTQNNKVFYSKSV